MQPSQDVDSGQQDVNLEGTIAVFPLSVLYMTSRQGSVVSAQDKAYIVLLPFLPKDEIRSVRSHRFCHLLD